MFGCCHKSTILLYVNILSPLSQIPVAGVMSLWCGVLNFTALQLLA